MIIKSVGLTAVLEVAVLLAGLVSKSADVTVAIFTNVPGEPVSITMVVVDVAPLSSIPKIHVIVIVPEHEPWLVLVATRVTPAGRLSVNVTGVDASGPMFVTVIVYVTV